MNIQSSALLEQEKSRLGALEKRIAVLEIGMVRMVNLIEQITTNLEHKSSIIESLVKGPVVYK